MFKLKELVMNGGGMGGGMGNGGGNNGGGGMGGSACYIYDDEQATQTGGQSPVDGVVNGVPVVPDVIFNRRVYMNGSMTMDDGAVIEMWGFSDPTAGNGGGGMGGGNLPFPSPAIILTAGDVAHTKLDVGMMGGGGGNDAMMWKHTIHHHGIEPEYRSDGVGHTSFDVAGSFTYQWKPKFPGTYFYHCHVNTVLHAEMGMYGVLIVRPKLDTPTEKYANENPTSRYDVEAIWAVDEIDPAWRVGAMNWAYGTCGDAPNVQLNVLNPKYFIISGVDGTKVGNGLGNNASSAYKPGSPVAATVAPGKKLLIRYIVAGYLPQMLKLPQGLTGQIIASDGRPLPKPITIDSNTPLNTVSAERYDIMITIPNNASGDYMVEFEIQDWISGNAVGTATTRITVGQCFDVYL